MEKLKQPQHNYVWEGKKYIVWYLDGGYYLRNLDRPNPTKVQGTLINVTQPFIGQIMVEEENTNALYIIPFQSIVLMEEVRHKENLHKNTINMEGE